MVRETDTQSINIYVCLFFVFFGGDINIFTCPYPLKVEACPPQDHRPATWTKVSGPEGVYLMMYHVRYRL